MFFIPYRDANEYCTKVPPAGVSWIDVIAALLDQSPAVKFEYATVALVSEAESTEYDLLFAEV